MIFYKKYFDVDDLNKDIRNNPQWLHEVQGYTDNSILVKWAGLSTKEFKKNKTEVKNGNVNDTTAKNGTLEAF